MSASSPRYAIYFTPGPSSPLALFGASVLGYDSSSGEACAHIDLKGIAETELVAATTAPRKYGFHATLVAPFYLGDDHGEANLLEALGAFCDQAAPASLGLLRVSALGHFIALTPGTSGPVNELARQCVTFFDSYRAPLSPEDFARRDDGHMTPRQRAHLARWGYPYVFEDFRFHMTLTGSLGADERSRFLAALGDAFSPFSDQAYDVDAVSLVRQVDSRSKFEVIARNVLQGETDDGDFNHRGTGKSLRQAG